MLAGADLDRGEIVGERLPCPALGFVVAAWSRRQQRQRKRRVGLIRGKAEKHRLRDCNAAPGRTDDRTLALAQRLGDRRLDRNNIVGGTIADKAGHFRDIDCAVSQPDVQLTRFAVAANREGRFSGD
jgi:hypothetical protein